MENFIFRMRFDCSNAAFEDGINGEVAEILRRVANKIERGEASGLYQNVHDTNGNVVGTFRLADENE